VAMVDIQKELTSIDSANLWQLLDEANERDTGLSLLLYVVKNKWEKKIKEQIWKERRKSEDSSSDFWRELHLRYTNALYVEKD